jgi:hypothetical protein
VQGKRKNQNDESLADGKPQEGRLVARVAIMLAMGTTVRVEPAPNADALNPAAGVLRCAFAPSYVRAECDDRDCQ